jgi:hypothetical protein
MNANLNPSTYAVTGDAQCAMRQAIRDERRRRTGQDPVVGGHRGRRRRRRPVDGRSGGRVVELEHLPVPVRDRMQHGLAR